MKFRRRFRRCRIFDVAHLPGVDVAVLGDFQHGFGAGFGHHHFQAYTAIVDHVHFPPVYRRSLLNGLEERRRRGQTVDDVAFALAEFADLGVGAAGAVDEGVDVVAADGLDEIADEGHVGAGGREQGLPMLMSLPGRGLRACAGRSRQRWCRFPGRGFRGNFAVVAGQQFVPRAGEAVGADASIFFVFPACFASAAEADDHIT